MTNMKLDAKEAKEYSEPSLAKDAPQYPYGLQITLDDEALQKLGLDELPEVGDTMAVLAKVQVCDVSSYQTMGGDKERRVCLQITDMEVHADTKDAAKELYG